MKTKLQVLFIFYLASSSLLSACGLEQLFGPIHTPTPTSTSTPTLASAPTLTPVPTFTPTIVVGAEVCVEPPAGLIGWWPGDGNANDIQGDNDGKLLDGATFATGLVGRAFSFDGVGHMSAPATGLPIDDRDRTVDLWVKVDTFYVGEAFFAAYGNFDTPDQAYYLGTSGKTLFFSQWGQAIYGPELESGRWYYVAVTNVGTFVTLYLDGKAVTSGDLRINTPGRTQLFIGSLPGDPSRRVNGLIDEVEIFNRALSPTEIQAIFLAGSNGICK